MIFTVAPKHPMSYDVIPSVSAPNDVEQNAHIFVSLHASTDGQVIGTMADSGHVYLTKLPDASGDFSGRGVPAHEAHIGVYRICMSGSLCMGVADDSKAG